MSKNLPSIASMNEAVVISIPKDEFGNFINDLLKSKRQIGRTFDHFFEIEKDNLNDIFSIIDFRIKEQNSANLIDCQVIVVYSDGSRRRYESIEYFMNTNDRMNSYSVAIHLTMGYLVQFSSDAPPMKQEIRVSANSLDGGQDIFGIIPVTIKGAISIDIKSNSFTWADDIIGHVSNYLNSKYTSPGLLSKILNATKEVYTYALLQLMMLMFIALE